MSFPSYLPNSNFCKKNQKKIKFGEIRKYMKRVFLKEKRLHPFKKHLLQNWRAENMAVVAARLVGADQLKWVVYKPATIPCKRYLILLLSFRFLSLATLKSWRSSALFGYFIAFRVVQPVSGSKNYTSFDQLSFKRDQHQL